MLKFASTNYRLASRKPILSKVSIRNNTTGVPSSFGEGNVNYSAFLKDIKQESERKSLHRKSFNEINEVSGNTNYDSPRNDKLTWTSQYDSVVRQPFAKDIIHLQSLLDALVASKNFDRADKILQAMYPIATSTDEFMFSMNDYLLALSKEEDVTIHKLENYLSNFKVPPLSPNDKTYAIFIAKSLNSSNFYQYMKYINEILSNTGLTRDVLQHVEILGIDNLSTIFKESTITRKHIPKELMSLYEQVTSPGEEEDYFSSEEKLETIPSISKEAEELKAVDAFGLKVIRHTLLGLKLSSEGQSSIVDGLLKHLEKDLHSSVIHNFSTSDRRDYFALYKSLKTDTERARFNEALDVFNYARQRNIETRGAESAKEKWKHDYEEMQKRGSLSFNKSLNAKLYEWYKSLLPFVKGEVNECHKILNGELTIEDCKTADEKLLFKDRSFYAPYLTLVPPEKMSAVTILELLRLNSTGGVVDGMRTAKALISVGKAVEVEYKAQKLMESEKSSISKKTRSTREWSKIFKIVNNKADRSKTLAFNEWDSTLQAKVGSVLTSLLMNVATVPVTGVDPNTNKTVMGERPAFFHTYQYVQGQKLGVLKLHKSIIKQLSADVNGSLVQPQFLPMLTPPRPWTTYNDGGYLFSQSILVRSRDSPETIAYLKAASERGHLSAVFDGLNTLGETAWTVNRKVLQVMTKFWNTGEEFLDIPAIIDEPQLPDAVPSDSEPDVLRDYQRKVRQAINDASSAKSQRCDTNYKLEIARAYIGERMFFPHNIDFRGRAYPISPHFNHLGNDLTRSLFLFWDGKELGEKGLWWLKVHLANLYGIDKVPLVDRAKFIDENLENIFKSAEDPYSKDSWWTKGEKPWQVLGCCFELAEAYKLENPAKYISHIPVHQDGSCNGLQHYAALGGDIEGARQVNLVPADRPQDVYSHVASLVQSKIDSDAANGDKYAIFLQDKITRKVVKQTVMTNVYGVTFIGARDQIKKQIKQYFDKDSEEDPNVYAHYLTTHVFGAVRELFEGAHLIQDWLGESARIISKSVRIDYDDTASMNADKPNHLSSVIWTTPLGLPCVQPYRATKRQIISTNLQDVAITDPFRASPVDSRKQKTALPPNFVHSLDATHMLMTASQCRLHNMSFASVHDSYWTHASNIDLLSKNLREQFVKLHQDNLVEKVKTEFEARYDGFLQVISVPRDHKLVKEIAAVKKKIVGDLKRAVTVADEIRLEKIRQDLLKSNDPIRVEQGKNLETTVSIVEKYNLEELPKCTNGAQILAPIKFPPVPKKGDFNVELVKDSTYFFS